jgi:hypothetical protein
MSFRRKGTPAKGPLGTFLADARACSNMGVTTALMAGLILSMRAMAASTSSMGLTFLWRTSLACSVASSEANVSV